MPVRDKLTNWYHGRWRTYHCMRTNCGWVFKVRSKQPNDTEICPFCKDYAFLHDDE